MKQFHYVIILTLFAFLLPLQAAQSKSDGRQKLGPKPADARLLLDLYKAGPVWKNAKTPHGSLKSSGSLQRALPPRETTLAVAAERGLKINEVQFAANGTLSFISGELGRASQLQSLPVPALAMQSAVHSAEARTDLVLAQQWLETFAPVLKLNQPAAELGLSRYETDALGMHHLRLQQSFKGLPVWAHELYLHVDATDQVYAVNGTYAPTPASIDPAEAVITAQEAIEKCRSHLDAMHLLHEVPAQLKKYLRFSEPMAQKVIWIDGQGTAHLAWQVDIYANLRDWFTLMLDAATGDVLHRYSNTMSEGSVDASGMDLGNTTRAFRAYEENGTYYMLSDLNELSGGSANLPDNPAGGLLILDLQNSDLTESSQFYFVSSTSRTSWNNKSAVSAIHNLNLVYNYFKNTHNRRAIDGQASTIIGVVNVAEDGEAMDNAFWNGSMIFWGNGSDVFSPLAEALDVAAHELAHGITEYTAGLIYQDQPGALNESFSDVFGAMVDRDDWYVGEDIMLPGQGTALRDLANPHNASMLRQLPKTMDEYLYTSEDNGGVHTNGGIPSHAAYLIATAIGREKTEQIYYRALSKYLTRQSQFVDARKAIEQSAIDLFGSNAELNSVKTAFDAVKIGTSGSGGTTTPSGAGDNEVAVTTGGSHWIAFVRTDQQVGLYDVANEIDYYFSNIRVNNYTQFTATADGRYLYFINEYGVLARIDVSAIPYSYQYETFDNIALYTPGDLRNCAVSRDGQFIALTSAYDDDNTIYLLLADQILPIPLEITTTQEGITGSTIIYPDVLNWSPNTKYPKLAFDAFNQVKLATGATREWWSMGEIDFTGDELRIYSLLPAQPEGISVGNVQYSSIDPDRIAYSFIDDAANAWDIQIVNFAETGQNQSIQFPNRNVQRPSFSPDDNYLVMDRFSDHKLLVLEISSLNYIELNLSTGARYPEWFVIGGDYDLQVDTPQAGLPGTMTLAHNYPNPFNASTTIRYELTQESRIQLAVFDIQGRLVRTLVDAIQGAGQHFLTWDGQDQSGKALASGVYFCRLTTKDGLVGNSKMILLR